MRVPDTNLLLYAINPDSPCRDAAQQCLNEAAQSSEGMGLTWIGLLAFLRLTTRPPVLLARRFVPPRALEATLLFCAVPAFVVNGNSLEADLPFLAFWLLSIALVVAGRAGLAAIAIEHNAEVLTFDRDFARFTGLRYQLLS